MLIVINILQRVLVNHFYKVNTGFFLFLFFVLFGIPHQVVSFHLSLIDGMLQSTVFLACVFALWFLYFLKCFNYTANQLNDSRQQFLFCLNNLSTTYRFIYMFFVQAMLYLPVLIYSIFILYVAFQKHYWLNSIAIIFFNAAILCIGSLSYLIVLSRKSILQLPKAIVHLPRLSKPLFSMPLFFIWHRRRQMLIITKALSLLLLYGFIHLYQPERHDIRPLLLCCIVSAVAHSAMVFEIRQFEEFFLSFTKNFPLTSTARFLQVLAMYSVLLIPEFIFLFTGFPLHFTITDYPQLLLMMIGLLVFFHTILLMDDITMDDYIKTVFAILTVLFFVVLYNPGIGLPVGLILLSLGFFYSYYLHFEKKY